jgi:hypothetical protein
LIPSTNQVADYQSRGLALADVNVWDFIRQVEKIKKTSDKRKHKPNGDEEDQDTGEFDAENDDQGVDLWDGENILDYSGRLRPRVELLESHLE